MEPVRSNTLNKTCPDTITSNCVTSLVAAAPCLQLCGNPSQTEVDNAQNTALCSLLAATDLSGIDLGCLYSSTVITWQCPVGQTFIADSSAYAINGTPGFCQICVGPPPTGCSLSTVAPVQSTAPNPVPAPTTLKGILELMISKIPCCDPCKGVNVSPVNPGS